MGVLFERTPTDVSHAALLADLKQRLGALEGACDVLQQTLDRLPSPPERLRDRLTSMACRRLLGEPPTR